MPRISYPHEKVFFTSDLHIGHAAILSFSKRPFVDLHAMREALIENWNAVVPEDGTVYVLGDAAPGHKTDLRDFFRRVNGTIRLLKGNHDRTKDLRWLANEKVIVDYRGAGFWRTYEEIVVQHPYYGRQKMILAHFPLRTWAGMYRGAWNLHGHSHSAVPEGLHPVWTEKRCDVGVDAWNYRPVTYLDLRVHFARYAECTPRNDREA